MYQLTFSLVLPVRCSGTCLVQAFCATCSTLHRSGAQHPCGRLPPFLGLHWAYGFFLPVSFLPCKSVCCMNTCPQHDHPWGLAIRMPRCLSFLVCDIGMVRKHPSQATSTWAALGCFCSGLCKDHSIPVTSAFTQTETGPDLCWLRRHQIWGRPLWSGKST